MTREEAVKMMEAGHKMTHKNFSSEEYVYINKYGRMYTEDECLFRDMFESTDSFVDGWRVYHE